MCLISDRGEAASGGDRLSKVSQCGDSIQQLSLSLAIIAVVNGIGVKLNTKFSSINTSLK
jgi:hypothetical protein